jgi:putative two-component system response regulator
VEQKELDLSDIQERVLVVDDDQVFLGLLQRNITFLGLEADSACNGREAADLLKDQEYGVVISDMRMPEMDGMGLICHIIEHHPQTDVLVISGYTDTYNFTDLITAGATDFIEKPFELDELRAKLQRIFRERGLLNDLRRAKDKEKVFFLHLVETLAMSLDEKDKYTHGHARRVTNLSLQLAEALADRGVDFELLRLSGTLHDIGKIGVPDSILLKEEKLSEEEFAVIKKHPEQGTRILQPMEFDETIQSVSRIIRHHHERYDGRGYPDGLKGEDIPFYSRIIAVADSYDAMTSDRPYRKGMDCVDAVNEIKDNAGTQFDPYLARKFVNLMKGCHEGDFCPSKEDCLIFAEITQQEISSAYEMQYCRTNYKSCARYKIKNKDERPASLLPDGGFLF